MMDRRFSALRSPIALLCFLLTAAVGLGLDQWSKAVAINRLSDGVVAIHGQPIVIGARSYSLVPGWIHFVPVVNTGAVFGIGHGRRALFIAVSLAAIVFIIYLFASSKRQPVYQIILGMLLAGVVGNLLDRWRFGYVRDMVHALPKWDVFPWVFNIADSLLCVGVFLMIVHSFIMSATAKKSGSASAARQHGFDVVPDHPGGDPTRRM